MGPYLSLLIGVRELASPHKVYDLTSPGQDDREILESQIDTRKGILRKAAQRGGVGSVAY